MEANVTGSLAHLSYQLHTQSHITNKVDTHPWTQWKYDPVASWTSTFTLPNCLDQQTCSTWSSANPSPSQDFWSPARVNRHWLQQMSRSSSTCLWLSALEQHVQRQTHSKLNVTASLYMKTPFTKWWREKEQGEAGRLSRIDKPKKTRLCSEWNTGLLHNV